MRMTTCRKMAWFIIGLIVGCIGTSLAGPIAVANPYATIASRNVFGLNPILTELVPVAPEPVLPRIVPKGFTTILGPETVLFEVVDGPAGKAAARSLYALKSGATQDGITVLRIDGTTGIITFDNHGKLQQIPLAAPATAAETKP